MEYLNTKEKECLVVWFVKDEIFIAEEKELPLSMNN